MALAIGADYRRFIFENWRFLGFGVLLTFLSSFGQTFFFGIYNSHIRETFDLSNAEFGSIYGILTIISAVCLVWVGKLIDRTHLRLYTILVLCLMMAGCFVMGLARALPVLYLAMFMLRFSGQGLATHISSTSMARYFDKERGKAVSFSNIGFSIGLMVLPFLAVYMAGLLGWQQSYTFFGCILAVIILPSILWFLHGHDARHMRWEEQQNEKDKQKGAETDKSWTQSMVLKDWRFYVIMSCMMTLPFIATGVFFFFGNIAEIKGWPVSIFATSLTVFAVTSAIMTFVAGFIIDRVGSVRLLPIFLVPHAVGVLLMGISDSVLVAHAFMFLTALSSGIGMSLASTLWAELYGVRHLGSIKSMTASLGVLSSALAPPVFGILLDRQITLGAIMMGLLVYIGICTVAQISVVRKSSMRKLDGVMP